MNYRALGASLSELKYFTEACAAGERIMEIIKRVPNIDSENMAGEILERVSGEVEFDNVKFVYPSRPDSVILNDFCLKIPAGNTVALVGGSGSGKSTLISLLQRFYDPIEAEIFLDGVAIQEEVVEVAKASNAHNFISQLPQGYDTQVSATSLVICQTNPIC